MATYAAYRHVELDKVGCGKRSIMKPPGGDSHDIFGADFHGTPSHHRVLKPPGGGTSSLFAPTAEETEKPRMTSSGVENSTVQSNVAIEMEGKTNGVNGKNGNRGKEESEPFSSKPLEEKGSELDSDVKKSSEIDLISTHSSLLSEEIKKLTAQEEKRQRNGNPVTGEGYDNPDTHAPAPPRARIPPGGYSSGLW